MKLVSFVLVAIVMIGAPARAQEKPAAPLADKAAPTLAVERKQTIQIAVQRLQLDATAIENAQLRAQAAQADLDQVRAALVSQVQSIETEFPGFTLDLQTLALVKKPEPSKAPEKKEPPK